MECRAPGASALPARRARDDRAAVRDAAAVIHDEHHRGEAGGAGPRDRARRLYGVLPPPQPRREDVSDFRRSCQLYMVAVFFRSAVSRSLVASAVLLMLWLFCVRGDLPRRCPTPAPPRRSRTWGPRAAPLRRPSTPAACRIWSLDRMEGGGHRVSNSLGAGAAEKAPCSSKKATVSRIFFVARMLSQKDTKSPLRMIYN